MLKYNTRNWRVIIEIADNNDGIVTRKQAIEQLGGYYYCNGEKYVSESLAKMVKAGVLVRVEGKRGSYRILPAKASSQHKPIEDAPTQLFLNF